MKQALGGAGAAIVYNEEDFEELLSRGLEISPIHEVMIDKAMMGWKEYELELLRDKNDNQNRSAPTREPPAEITRAPSESGGESIDHRGKFGRHANPFSLA